ncbi:MAG: hypothetical protein GEU93_14740 [Propionibacteriales bacterium]|nr:hypothetical protein [Propionibacteriales bacterium]
MLSPLDDYPIHQIPEPVRFVETSDRNFYDRYYFNAYSRTDDIFLVMGMGQYPNLSTTDAFVAVRQGDRQQVVRASTELGVDRSDTKVGPFEVEVIEGLRSLRMRCGPNEGGIELDLVWNGTTPPVLEPRHFYRNHARVASNTMRLTQTGAWTGELRIGADTFTVDPQTWTGTRDRSWGIRAVGEAEPRGIRDALPAPGFFWLYSPMQFDDFAILTILHEDRNGARVLEEAVRVWPEETGRDPEPLGHPIHEIEFVEGTRTPARARLTFTDPDGNSLPVNVEPLLPLYVALGCGYGNDHDWRHGMYQGKNVVQYRSYDLTDPEVQARSRGVTDYAARFELEDGSTGYGLFEFTILGPYEPYGFGSRSR